MVTPFLSKEVPAAAPGAALEVSLDVTKLAGAQKEFSCKFELENPSEFI